MFDPQQALLDLLQPGGSSQTLFPPTSRYYGIPTSTLIAAGGAVEIYLRRRFLPALPTGDPAAQYTVNQGDRLDHIAFRFFADPEQFWRIADANTEMNATDLTRSAGRVLRIPAEGTV